MNIKISETTLFLFVLLIALVLGNLIAYKLCFDRLHYSYIGTTTVTIDAARKLNQESIQDIVIITDNTNITNGLITTQYNFSSKNYYPELKAICIENHYDPFYLYNDNYTEPWVARSFAILTFIILIIFFVSLAKDNLQKRNLNA